MGLVFNIQRFSIHDGPGIRTAVFFQGCNLHCAWCHNPESQPLEPVVQFFSEKCIVCAECTRVCPAEAQQLVEGTRLYQRDLCQSCGACVAECYARALVIPAQALSPAQVLAEVLKDRDYYRDSGGGVTFSGGEPFLQKDFLLELLALCRQAGLHTAVDTAGNVPFAWLAQALPLTDLFLYDCKTFDEPRHRSATGVSNQRILQNLQQLGQAGARLWVRIPVIPGVNDAAAEIRQIGDFLSGVPGVEQVELLPFHHLGAGKYESLGLDYPTRGLTPPGAEAMAELVQVLQGLGLPTRRMV